MKVRSFKVVLILLCPVLNSLNQVEYKHEMFTYLPLLRSTASLFPLFGERRERGKCLPRKGWPNLSRPRCLCLLAAGVQIRFSQWCEPESFRGPAWFPHPRDPRPPFQESPLGAHPGSSEASISTPHAGAAAPGLETNPNLR